MVRPAHFIATGSREPVEVSATRPYTVQIISSLAHLQSLATPWNDLLLDSGADTIFLSWEWLFAWANCFLNSDRSLFILAVHHADKLIGIAPFYIQRVRHKLVLLREIRFLGSPDIGSDYLDVISRHGCEKQVAEVIHDYLFDQARTTWDELRLTDILAESLFLLHFMKRVDEQGKFKEIQRCAVMPQAILPDSVDAFQAGLSARRRSRLRQDMRRLAQLGETRHQVYRAETYRQGLERFFHLYDSKSAHNGNKLYPFLRRLVEIRQAQDWLQIDILSNQGRDIAGLLHLQYEDTLFLLLMVVDKQFNRKISLGNLLVGECIHNAINDGIHTYDFLKGDEDYKYLWAGNTRASLSVIMDQQHIPSIITAFARLGKYAIKVLVR